MQAAMLGCLLFVIPATAWAGDHAAIEKFEKTVRPLLIERCVSCHGPQKQKGGLRLDIGEGLVKGGDSGPVVVAGKPDESSLIRAVRYADDLKMPPKGRLSDAEVAALTDWVRSGAEWPAVGAANPTATGTPSSPKNDAPHWAFQPIKDTVPPEVKAASWPKSPIDRFILDGLEQRGLTPAPPAREARPDPPRDVRPDRAAAHSRGGRRVPRATTPPTPSRRSSTACSPRLATASDGAATGSTWPAMPTPTGWTKTSPTPTPIAIATT